MATNCAIIYLMFLATFIAQIFAEISNDIDVPSRRNLPKPVSYFSFPQTEDDGQNSERPQEGRFAYPGVTNLEAYGPNVLAQGYYPWKFDLGGVLLGSVVGLGALLLIPKVMHLLVPELAAFGHTYGAGSPYGRNADIIPQGVTEIVSQFEKVLTENNINSSECLQKAICSYVQSSVPKHEPGRSADTNNNIEQTISNGFINFLIEGSKFKMAIENGKQDVSCSVLYPKCPFNQDSIATGIKQLILSNTTTFSNGI